MAELDPASRSRMSLDLRLTLTALLAGLPGVASALILLVAGGYSGKVQWTVGLLVVCVWVGGCLTLRERVVRTLQTLANLIAALREGDYSVRGRGARRDDALGEVLLEVNVLSDSLRHLRLEEVEASALLAKVMEEIDVAVFTFDAAGVLRLVNRAGERLVGQPAGRLLGKTAEALGLADLLLGEAPRTLEHAFPAASGPWELRRSAFRQEGLPHQLVVLADLRRALREEERQAWQRLVRVLGHEINNSLAPIRSIATGLLEDLGRSPRAPEWEDDLGRGLAVVARRSESLSRFMTSYAQLARLPPPRRSTVDVQALIRRVVDLEKRLPVQVLPGPAITIEADGDQLEQLLINLIRNAADAALETHGGVTVSWTQSPSQLEVSILDEGPGLSDTKNLFVPFFTTKPQGSGIGLVLSRQIAEAHHGSLRLTNAAGGKGCEARLCLPRHPRI
jgi:two-component system, NtrC family, nitrogen regulation sensor histidine kinase NtrY